MALKAMNAHRLRTALTMTGIIFGIAAVVTVVALGEGAKQRTLENIKGLGTNVVSIYPGRDFFDDAIDSIRTTVPADADALAQQSFVDSVSPEVSASDSIRFRSKSATASITGVGRDYFRVNGITLVQGATFRDDRNALQEVIIDDNARRAVRRFRRRTARSDRVSRLGAGAGGRRRQKRTQLCAQPHQRLDALQHGDVPHGRQNHAQRHYRAA